MSENQYGFYVDTSRCIKCWACVVSCKQWHEIEANTVSRRRVNEEVTGTFPDVKRRFTSLSCMHCAEPACVAVCPQGALSKRDEDGIVVVDLEKCIGCKTCSTACPFDVPQYADNENGQGVHLDKCDTCLGIGRAEGEMPHCVTTCPVKALNFGPLDAMMEFASAKGGELMEGETGPSVVLS